MLLSSISHTVQSGEYLTLRVIFCHNYARKKGNSIVLVAKIYIF